MGDYTVHRSAITEDYAAGNPGTTVAETGRPSAPVVEIIEYINGVVNEADPLGVVIPNDVRINGVSLLCSDDPVTVHEVTTGAGDLARVTLTLLARRVLIEQRTKDSDAPVADH